jgi:hypothetical protein
VTLWPRRLASRALGHRQCDGSSGTAVPTRAVPRRSERVAESDSPSIRGRHRSIMKYLGLLPGPGEASSAAAWAGFRTRQWLF